MGSLEIEVNQLHSELCAGLADPKRILILYALSQGPLNVSEIADTLNLPQPTTSRHLGLLRERNLVVATREGTSVYYTLADKRVIEALDILRAVLADHLHSQGDLAQRVSSSRGTKSGISKE
jgi:DNA-binding transcriptional ArsR family regulator